MPNKDVNIFDADFPSSKNECVYEEISICPICHCAIVPTAVTGSYIKELEEDGTCSYKIYILFFCPNCRDMFLVKYSGDEYYKYLRTDCIQGQWPILPKPIDLSDAVKDMSSMFVTTYTEANQAETENLLEIAGCGYRKAVEYLVKDYLCKKIPESCEDIKRELLGTAIKRIEDDRIKTLAERAVWIGNDETHYIRKHENHDIEDMKRFISAMLHYIDAELALEEALAIEPAK